ncbi:MAG: Rpn family recombination-promoting nuclease/putative transposase [Deltaproteobacteria bacterium]|nr:Rpn family recombination-promoting nuclease/putative transposase [Deltaproteobacteria bacterium]
MKTDSLFYRLFQSLPSLLFDFIAQAPDHAGAYRFDSVELKQIAFRLDGVFAPPPEQPDWPLFFIEVQFQPDPNFYVRLFAEIFLYLHQHRPAHPWQAVVIYPTRATDPGEHPHYRALLESEQVRRVYLDEWAASRQTLTQHLMMVLLAEPRQAVPEARAVITRAQQELVDTEQATTIVELVETILVYKLPRVSRQEIQIMLGLTDIDLKQTRFYQDVFAEGRQEGHQKGQLEGEATLIRRQLQRRCGTLAPALATLIARLNVQQLEALGEALLDFHNTADLEQWLAAHGTQARD